MVNYLSVDPYTNMSPTKVGLGVPMPLLAPATATWAAPFAFYYIFLQNRIAFHRITTKSYVANRVLREYSPNCDDSFLGDKSDASKEAGADPLYVASRAQLNFAENVPLVLGIALLAELNGAKR
jgi:uncharacterized membrane protein YecN with MAPEG domain